MSRTAEDLRKYRDSHIPELGIIESYFVDRTVRRVTKDLHKAASRGESTIQIKYSINKHVESILKSRGFDVLFTGYDHTYHITFRKNGFKPPDVRGMKI